MTYQEKNGAYLIRFMPDEEVCSLLQQFCQAHNLTGGWISGLGAAKEVELAHFNMVTKQYTKRVFHEVEVTSFVGNISVEKLHLHITIGDETLQAYAGHCMRCVANPTLEVMITPFSETHRKLDEYSGLQLLHLPNPPILGGGKKKI
ncbi:MAG: PPC domain-containing DNA-binding protein [Patescibacteria group bacterium]|jgi:hypothetical protein